MAPVELYIMKESPPCRLVQMVATSLNVPVNEHLINLFAGDHMKEDYLKLNPEHKVPFLVDGNVKMGESRAICQYLANKYGAEDNKLYPKCPEARALVDEMLMFDGSTLYPAMSQVYKPVFQEGKGVDPEKVEQLKKTIQVLEGRLASGSKFITGDNLTIADIALAASLTFSSVFSIDLSEFKHLVPYMERCHETIPKWKEINEEPLANMKKFVESKLAAIGEKP